MSKTMKLGTIIVTALPLWAAMSFPSASKSAGLSGVFKPDDGTYKSVPIDAPEQCSALCKADPKCRGAVTYQPDVTKSAAICRLNDGFGSNPVFPQVPPEDLNLEIALSDLNRYRAQYGLKPVRLDSRLIEASRIHAHDLSRAGIISHTGTDGSNHGDRALRVGYNYTIAGENVATGQKSWDAVFQAWKDSPGHNKNLLQPDVSEFGIALVYEPKTTYSTYWSMLVAEPMNLNRVSSRRIN